MAEQGETVRVEVDLAAREATTRVMHDDPVFGGVGAPGFPVTDDGNFGPVAPLRVQVADFGFYIHGPKRRAEVRIRGAPTASATGPGSSRTRR